jgi:8-oxo-dGTP pyrophosphatase MutT (NUDIX family)
MQPGQHRATSRVILHNENQEIFLLKTHFDPEVGLPPRWITPGGGIDEGETILEAAVRELREETGIRVSPEALGDLIWTSQGRWDWSDGQNHNTFTDHFYKLQVSAFELDVSGWTEDERRDVLEFRWWSAADLIETEEFIGPPGLAEFVAGHFSS